MDGNAAPKPDNQVLARMLYLCDRKACGDVCPNPECAHTDDIRHARSFQRTPKTVKDGQEVIYFVER